jgi:hypothetical protein
VLPTIFNVIIPACLSGLFSFAPDMKLLFRIFLSLCFLLTGGYSYVYSSTSQDHVRNTRADNARIAHYTGLHLTFSRSLPSAENVHDKMECKDSETEDEDEDEEDEEVSHTAKKGNNYLTSLFCILATGGPNTEIATGLPLTKHFSTVSSCRYILFRSFRV